jgi:hypothetical protein
MDAGPDTRRDVGPDADAAEDVDVGGDTDDARMDADASDVPDMQTGDARADGGSDVDAAPNTDTDGDGLVDCDEVELCTSPTNADTDGDGLNDYEEFAARTEPCKPDSDGDGVEDGTEVDVGLDPNKASTFDDGISDGDRWRANPCAPPQNPQEDFTGTINYHTNQRGNYKLGLPRGFSGYRNLVLNNVTAPMAASVYSNPSASVYGFLLSKNHEAAATTLKGLRASVLQAALAVGGNNTDNLLYDVNGSGFDTHDGHRASIGRYVVQTPSAKSPAKVREELLLGLDAFGQDDVGGAGLPSTSGQAYTTFRIFASVVRRSTPSPKRALVSVAVVPESIFDTSAQVRFTMDDLTNTTNLSERTDGITVGCESFKPRADTPEAYFYWVLDQSGGAQPYISKVVGMKQDLFGKLNGSRLDHSVGVTNMDPGNNGHLYNPWTRSAMQFGSDVQDAALDCTGWNCSQGIEEGLKVAYQGIRYMRGMTSMDPPASEAISSSASLFTLFLTDEKAGSVHLGNTMPSKYLNFFPGPGNTTAHALTVTENCEDQFTDGQVYRDVSESTGGEVGSICSDNLSEVLLDIIHGSVGQASGYELSETPVSASMSVFVESDQDPTTSTFVPRSRDDGYDYFAEENSVAFFGSFRPSDDPATPYSEDFIAVRYEYFTSP